MSIAPEDEYAIRDPSCRCVVGPYWCGSPSDQDPANVWECADCGRLIPAERLTSGREDIVLAYQCSHWERDRPAPCPNRATHLIYAPDGTPVPGLWCEPCTRAVITEYAETLGQQWTARRIRACEVSTTLRDHAKALGATVEQEPDVNGCTVCYRVIAPDGKAWKVGPTCLRVEWSKGADPSRAMAAALADMHCGLVDGDTALSADQEIPLPFDYAATFSETHLHLWKGGREAAQALPLGPRTREQWESWLASLVECVSRSDMTVEDFWTHQAPRGGVHP